MDRFTSEPYAQSTATHTVWGDVRETEHDSECQNCQKATPVLTWVEGWNYYGCDDCYEEAERERAKDATPRKPVSRQQGELFNEEVG